MVKLLLIILITWLGVSSEAQTIYVATGGKDSNPGTKSEPVATFGRAQLLAQKTDRSKPVEVIFASGIYYLPQTVKITAEDNPEGKVTLTFTAEEEGKVTNHAFVIFRNQQKIKIKVNQILPVIDKE